MENSEPLPGSESNQAAIFQRFYREEEVHEQQGVGIGLYLAREIVTLGQFILSLHFGPT